MDNEVHTGVEQLHAALVEAGDCVLMARQLGNNDLLVKALKVYGELTDALQEAIKNEKAKTEQAK